MAMNIANEVIGYICSLFAPRYTRVYFTRVAAVLVILAGVIRGRRGLRGKKPKINWWKKWIFEERKHKIGSKILPAKPNT